MARKGKSKIYVLALLVLIVLLLIGAICYRNSSKKDTDLAEATSGDTIEVNGKRYTPKRNLELYLIMGIDKAEINQSYTNINDQQTDFNALIIADLKAETYTLLYLNRDIMTDVPILALDGTPYMTQYEQLALAHTYGSGMEDSCENTVNTVSALLNDVFIDHYVAFYLPSIGVLNDAVGGVTVTIEDDFSADDPTMILGETITLNATQAEHFVRSRMDVADGTNLNRMKRQMTYLSAWTELATQKMDEDASFAATLAKQLGDVIVTDLTLQQISDLAEVFDSYELAGSYELEGEAVKGEQYMEYYLDDAALEQTILELFYNAK